MVLISFTFSSLPSYSFSEEQLIQFDWGAALAEALTSMAREIIGKLIAEISRSGRNIQSMGDHSGHEVDIAEDSGK